MATNEMTTKEHKKRHLELHKCLDELVADYIDHTKKSLSRSSIIELMNWSCTQVKNPTEI